MRRRDFLATVGLGTTTTFSGCATMLTGSSDSTDETPTPAGPRPPVPGKAQIATIQGIDEGKMELSLDLPKLPRPVTFELHRFTPSATDPGTWRYNTIGEDIWPVLSFDGDGTVVSRTEVTYDGAAAGGFVTVDFPADDEPMGRPLTYRVDLIEHTLNNERRSLGYTPLLIRRPDTGTYEYQQPDGGWALNPFYELYHHTEVTSDGAKTITLTTSSTESRWNVPRHERLNNRPNEVSGYHRAWYERPWAIQYTISDADYEEVLARNIDQYIGDKWSGRYDYRNLDRLVETEWYMTHPVIAEVAEKLNEAAENAGLTTPLEKLRLVCDFLQWMPYTSDKSLPKTKPRVKAPVTTLYEFTGDCEDKVALGIALLYQDALPDYTLATFYIARPGHVGIAIKKEIFEQDLDSVGNKATYFYAEVTYPAPLGMISDGWSTPNIMHTAPPGHPQPKKPGE